MTPGPAPIRCFFRDIGSRAVQKLPPQISHLRLRLRLFGSIAGIDAPHLVLIDGTGCATLQVTDAMINKLQLAEGMSVDCIGAVYPNEKDPSSFRLVAEQICLVNDLHAETLRWTEIVYAESLSAKEKDEWCGYPVRQVKADDVLQVIATEPQGVSLEDVALGFDLTEVDAKSFIEELQLSGQIYCNERGLFVPL